jgi:hypothetical protein
MAAEAVKKIYTRVTPSQIIFTPNKLNTINKSTYRFHFPVGISEELVEDSVDDRMAEDIPERRREDCNSKETTQ